MTDIGVLFLITLFVIVILGVIVLGQAETIKEQKKEIESYHEVNGILIRESRELLRLSKEGLHLRVERDALRKTLEDLK